MNPITLDYPKSTLYDWSWPVGMMLPKMLIRWLLFLIFGMIWLTMIIRWLLFLVIYDLSCTFVDVYSVRLGFWRRLETVSLDAVFWDDAIYTQLLYHLFNGFIHFSVPRIWFNRILLSSIEFCDGNSLILFLDVLTGKCENIYHNN